MPWPPTPHFRATRIGNAPIIHPGMPSLEGPIGRNINGPSLIRAPEWLSNRLGTYYLYFAHHQGEFIRLATAKRIEGPYTVYKPGVLPIRQFADPVLHVASPDMHLDEEKREMRMYFHAHCRQWGRQLSFRAHSPDGIRFDIHPEPLGMPYFRVFFWRGAWYAFAKKGNEGTVIHRSPDGLSQFLPGPHFMPDSRHTALWIEGETLYLFHSNYREIERILVSTIDLSKPWEEWQPENTQLLIEPERDYEGANLPREPSRPGAIHEPACQLRDPAIYEENGVLYLLYSVAGEQGIALARLERIRP